MTAVKDILQTALETTDPEYVINLEEAASTLWDLATPEARANIVTRMKTGQLTHGFWVEHDPQLGLSCTCLVGSMLPPDLDPEEAEEMQGDYILLSYADPDELPEDPDELEDLVDEISNGWELFCSAVCMKANSISPGVSYTRNFSTELYRVAAQIVLGAIKKAEQNPTEEEDDE